MNHFTVHSCIRRAKLKFLTSSCFKTVKEYWWLMFNIFYAYLVCDQQPLSLFLCFLQKKEPSFLSFSYLNLCNVKGFLHTHFSYILCKRLFLVVDIDCKKCFHFKLFIVTLTINESGSWIISIILSSDSTTSPHIFLFNCTKIM